MRFAINVNRFWSILFFLVPIAGTAAFLMAIANVPPLGGMWLPKNYSESGKTIDDLFNMIHVIVAVIFVGTGLAISWILWKYSNRNAGEKAVYIHANAKLELLWSVIPCLILLFIAFYQMNAWANIKIQRPMIDANGQTTPKPPMVLVKAKQFGWEFHYAGPDNRIQTQDDFYVENLLVIPDDEVIVLQLESQDVIHSFFVPRLRLKQDVVPGMIQFAWFTPTAQAEMEIACAELCGWGHYKMKGLLRIVSRQEYQQFLADQERENQPPEFTQ